MLNSMRPPELHRWIYASRAPFIFVAPLITLLLWRWARQLWYPRAALVLAALWALEPTALGHAGLFKNDLSATLGYLAFWYSAWRFWQAPGWRSVLGLSLALTFALLTKLSLLVLLPVAPALLCIQAFKQRRWGEAALWPATAILLAYGLCSAACQFEMRRLLPAETALLRLPAAATFLPLPARYIDGTLSLLSENQNPNQVYLLGRQYAGGTGFYFLAALALKTPLPMLLLLLAAAALALSGRLVVPGRSTPFFLVFPAALYFGLASLSSLQLGHRLALPALPFLILLCGLPVQAALQPGRRWVPAAALVWTTAAVCIHYPYTISYFNHLAPTLEARLFALSDSNIDWGHGLPALRQWCLRNRVARVRLSYFGNDPPHRHFPDEENMVELVAPPWNDELARGTRLRPEAGVWAVSATLLTGQFFDARYKDYYRVFRERQPDDVVGGSILIYRIPAQ
jgi:hypothetical protein